MKTNEKSLSDFTTMVKSDIAATIETAKSAGITDADIDAIIQKNYEEHTSLTIARVVTRIRKLLVQLIEIRSATLVSGCVVGGRDKADRGGPIRYLLLKTDKKHLEVANFGHNTQFKLDEEYPIPVPSLLTLRIVRDAKFNSWNMVGIEKIEAGPIDKDMLISVMGRCEIPIKSITKEMTFDKEKERDAAPIVIYGKISAIQPEVVFKEKENRTDKAVVERTLNVLEQTEAGLKPCFSFAIQSGGGRFVRCHIEHQKFGNPTLLIEDLRNLCERAVQKHPTDPKAQANYLNDWLGDLDVLVAGVPSSYRESTDKEKRPTTNIEIGVAAVCEVKERVEGQPTQTTVSPQSDKPATTSAAVTPSSQTPPPAAPTTPAQPVAPVAPAAKSGGTPSLVVKNLMRDIRLWCSAANIDPSGVTLDTIRAKTGTRYEYTPDGAIMEAIERIKTGEPAE